VLLPGLGGSGIEQFARLGPLIGAAGFTAVAIDPRGVGDSSGPLDSLTLHDLAADVAGVIKQLALGPAVVLGRAYGNRVARCLAADRPALVRAVVLLAAGGLVPMPVDVRGDFERLTSPDVVLENAERVRLLQKLMLSPKSDPGLWLDMSTWRAAEKAQLAAVRATPRGHWWTAGSVPVLIVQGLDDCLAVPENGRRLKQQLGERAEIVEIPDAGHALFVEQPAAVTRAILEYLAGLA